MKIVLFCPFVEERDTDFYSYNIPVSIILIINTVFLMWIMLVWAQEYQHKYLTLNSRY